jgi:hypothetical protein
MTDDESLPVGADLAIALMDAATRANLNDSCRRGFLIELPALGEVMVTGDLHGHTANLRRITQLANLQRFRDRHLILQELVHELDSITDVCRSYRLLEMAARLKTTFPHQVHVLLGNHEFSELLNLEIGKRGRELNSAFREGVEVAYGFRGEDVIKAYHRFWRSCPLAVHTENRLFISHSTPRMEKGEAFNLEYFRKVTPAEVFQREGPIFSLLWGRDYRPEAAEAFAERMQADVLMVGHTACKEGLHVPNARHVILDCKDLDGRYALLPLTARQTQAEVLARVHKLYG